MSGLVTGLSLGGAFAGAVAGGVLHLIGEAGGFFINVANVMAGGRADLSNPSGLSKSILAGALAGLAAGGGSSLAYEHFTQASTSSSTVPAQKCSAEMPVNSATTVTTNPDGTATCTYAPR